VELVLELKIRDNTRSLFTEEAPGRLIEGD